MGIRNEKGKSGRKRGEAQSGSAATPARPRRVLSEKGSLWSEEGENVCLSRCPRAQRAGDGAASAAPSAKPPTCSRLSHIFMDTIFKEKRIFVPLNRDKQK